MKEKVKFCLFLICVIVFALIYNKQLKGHIPEEERMTEAFYNSILTQTLTGSSSQPQTITIKRTIMLQSFIGYVFMAGFIIQFLCKAINLKRG